MHMLVENATSAWGQSREWVLHKHSCIQFIALVPSALVLWTVCTCACAKPIPEIVPMLKLDRPGNILRLSCFLYLISKLRFIKKNGFCIVTRLKTKASRTAHKCYWHRTKKCTMLLITYLQDNLKSYWNWLLISWCHLIRFHKHV